MIVGGLKSIAVGSAFSTQAGIFGYIQTTGTGPPGASSTAANAYLGSTGANYAGLWLGVSPGAGNYAIKSSASGDTTVNASTGQTLSMCINNGVIASFGATGLVVSTSGGLLSTAIGTSGSNGVVPSVASVTSATGSIVGNGADTTEDNLMTYSIPANAFSATGKGIRYTAWGDGVSTADVTTVRMYFGHATTLKSGTLVITKVLTASQANTWHLVAEVFASGANAQAATAVLTNGGTAASLVQSNATPAGTTSGVMIVGCTGQRATTSSANSVRQIGQLVEFIN